jgi:hypothetical protein
MTTALESAKHWEQLAAKEIEMAKWYESNGLPYGDVSSYYHRAETYTRTAKVLFMEAETGKPHCSLCLGDHANHLHPHRG